MNSWWSAEVDYIQPFSMQHLVYIAIVLAVLAALVICRGKLRAQSSKITAVVLTVAILQQMMLYSWYAAETGFNMNDSLPLHICRITTLLGIYFLITKNTIVLDVIFYFGLFAYGSFLYPQRIYPITHSQGLSYLLSHMLVILLPYYGYKITGWRPTLKGVIRTYGLFVVYFFFVYFLNPLIDGNYFYLKYRPFFGGWPDLAYVPATLAVTLVGFLLAFAVVRSCIRNTDIRDKNIEVQNESNP
ncbi:TIGR02206 family membrane protein [Cohnella lubricantis]|uniref:TIGR02206 family membrane protein n=1 Tax=Cohnella lubricantis TaxID=2163172 RepID=A0A841TCB3_9BACL|nr:TIGR02206 family membrane protein [Cohnella lubricantis]MBB6678944.1 TIGR02206 family membrane protein [Cohnella lubricantis]MBP2118838.1 putative integral membrane protein (TIGR02206 family) [Cohnella lubricantis]